MLLTSISMVRPQDFGPTQQLPSVYILEITRPPIGKSEPVVDWVLVERREAMPADSDEGTVNRARLNISYWDLSAGADARDVPSGDFSASYDAALNLVSITSGSLDTGGYVLIEPTRLRGVHLGTYLMNLIVGWAKQWPQADVREVRLLAGDAHGANRLRRNRFYEQFGIRFTFNDEYGTAGVSQPMTASDLTEVSSWRKSITEHDLVGYLRRSTDEFKALSADRHFFQRELRSTSLALNDAYMRPITWMFKRLILDDLSRTLLVGASAVLAGLGVYRLI